MKKAISVRYNRELMAVFARYDKLTGGNLSRPKAVEKWLGYLASLPKDKETAALLHAASLKIYDEPVKPFESLRGSDGMKLDLAKYMQEHIYMYSSPNTRCKFRIAQQLPIEDVAVGFELEVE